MGVLDGQPVNAAVTNAAFLNKNQPDTMPFPLVVTVNSSSEALRVTQTGSGLALRVEDSSNPDASPFVVDASGNVGVGIESPVFPVDIHASGAISILNLTATGANNNAQLNLSPNGTGNATIKANTNSLTFVTNNNERLRIDSSGRALIGTSASRTNFASSASFLQIESTSSSATPTFIRNSNDTVGSVVIIGKSRGTSVGSFTAVTSGDRLGSLAFAGADGTSLLGPAEVRGEVDGTVSAGVIPTRLTFVTTNSTGGANERLRIDSSGNVGIGTNSPNGRLTVSDNQDTSNGTILEIKNTNTGISANNALASLKFYNSDSSTNAAGYSGIIKLGFIDAGLTPYMGFHVGVPSGGDAQERLRIDSSGRVLVGTTNANANILADAKMAIVGVGQGQNTGLTMTGYSGTSSTAKPILSFQKSRATTDQSLTAVIANDELGSISFRGADGTNFIGSSAILGEVDGAVTTGDVPGRLTFRTMSGGTLTERMRINSSGNVGLNTTNPTQYLHVASRTAGDSPTILVSNDGSGTGNATVSLFRNSTDFVRIRHNPGGGNQTLEFVATHSTTPGIRFYTSVDGTTLTERLRMDSAGNFSINSTAASGNFGIGTNTFGTNANRTFSILSGTEPTTAIADTIQINSVDLTAGNTIPAIRAEGTGITNAGITNTAVTNKIAIKINGTVYYLLATTNGT